MLECVKCHTLTDSEVYCDKEDQTLSVCERCQLLEIYENALVQIATLKLENCKDVPDMIYTSQEQALKALTQKHLYIREVITT
jgi:preprotein translocase subunit SecA